MLGQWGGMNDQVWWKKGNYFTCIMPADARVWGVKKRIKICTMQPHGQLLPPCTAALPKLVCKYEYIMYSCTISNDLGGRSNCIFGRLACLRGFVFHLKQVGSLPKEKKWVWRQNHKFSCGKKKGRNWLTSIFLWMPPLSLEHIEYCRVMLFVWSLFFSLHSSAIIRFLWLVACSGW